MKSDWLDYDFNKIPFSNLVRLGQRSLLYKDLFCVSWLLGKYCNYKCSYCWTNARSDVKFYRSTELILSTLAEIKKQARNRGFGSFQFSFSGGEPTLHPGYLKILETYSRDTENCDYQCVHMTTNLSPGLAWFKKYIVATRNLHQVSVTASYHEEFADEKKFLEKVIFLQANNVHVTINIVMVPGSFDKLWERALFYQEQGVNVTLKPQSDPHASKIVNGYSGDMLKKLQEGMPQKKYTPKGGGPLMQMEFLDEKGDFWYMDQAERLNSFGFNQFKGWECSAGYRSIIINEPSGAIHRSYACRDEPLGYIGQGFNLFETPRACVTDSCLSSADSKIPKRKRGARLPLWPGDETFKR